MTDIRCRVCGEPWDTYCLHDGTFLPWQVPLFRAGAGCPACEGEAPTHDDVDARTLDHMRDVVMGAEDPDAFTTLHTPDAPRPRWERPADPTLWECAGCGASVRRDVDAGPGAEDGGRYWHHSKLTYQYAGRLPDAWYDALQADAPPDEAWIPTGRALADGTPERLGPYCPVCVTTCAQCSTVVYTGAGPDAGDTYDPGWSTPDPRDPYHGGTLCIDCLKSIPTCCDCGEYLGDTEDTDDEGRCESCRPDDVEEDATA